MFVTGQRREILDKLIADPRFTEPKWWDEYFEVIDNMRDNCEKLKKENQDLREHLGEITNTLEEMQPKVTELLELRARKHNEEPWIDIMGGDVDPEKGMQLQMDWNDAFIDQLRANGYKGTSESELISQWLGQVYGNISQDLQQEQEG